MQIDEIDAQRVMQKLDQTCWQCLGAGTYGSDVNDCDICYGTGYQPTRAGIELLNFLRRQQKRIEQEKV